MYHQQLWRYINQLKRIIQTHFLFAYSQKNNTAVQPIYLRPMTENGCAELCPIDEFFIIIKNRVVIDWSSACAIQNSKFNKEL